MVYDASSNTENGIREDISVYLYGSEIEEKAMKATYVGGSLYYDIAVLRVEDSEILKTSNACAVDVADSDKVAVGDSAIAIGNAQGLGISSTSGIVSVDSEYITMTATGSFTIEETVCVYEVSSGSLADGILQAKDILVSATVNGNTTEITRQYHIIDMMLNVRAGDVVTLKILRDSEEMTVSITITEECMTAY